MKWTATHKDDGIGHKISFYDSTCGRFHIHAVPNQRIGARGQVVTEGREYHAVDKHSGHRKSFGKLNDAKAWCGTQPAKDRVPKATLAQLLVATTAP